MHQFGCTGMCSILARVLNVHFILLLAYIMYNFNLLLNSGLVHLYHLNESICSCRGAGGCLHFYCILPRNYERNSVDPGQTRVSVVFEQGLHCFEPYTEEVF